MELWILNVLFMRRNTIVILFLLVAHMAMAVPARQRPFAVVQPDGTRLVLTIVGDERFHYYLTEDGIPVLQGNTGDEISYYYATIKDDVIIPSTVMAHSKEKRSTEEEYFIASSIDTVQQCIERKKAAIRQERARTTLGLRNNPIGNTAYHGQKRGLVILVNFSDVAMSPENPNETFARQMNEVGYSDNGHIGSVHDYFFDQSYGLFDLTFDVVGPVTVSRNVKYYGINDIATGRGDVRVGQMVTEACRLADGFIDFSDYDWNGDGEVEQVFLIYAGRGEASGGASYTIWPHKYSLTNCQYRNDGEGPLLLDGVKVDTYACSCELAEAFGNTLNGIGVVCHEFSHCLGLPDIYDVGYNGAFGMNRWDIMDAGSYSGPNAIGEVPYGYSAYERACVGWLNMIELDGKWKCTLPPLNDTPVAYRINNRGNRNEFFVLENHQSDGWYSYLGEYRAPHGMMITHIDYSSSAWESNTVNTDPMHMRTSIVPADKDYGTFINENKRYNVTESEFAGDLFPGDKNVGRFSSESFMDCGGKLFNENYDGSYNLNLTVDNIKEEDGNISFTVGSRLEAPKNITASQTDNGMLYIQWDAVEDAEEYSVEVLKIWVYQPLEAEKNVIEDVNGTSLDIENVDCENIHIRLRANNSYVASEWSEYICPEIYTNGISDVWNDCVTHGELYTLDGRKIKSPQGCGMYIYKENNRTRKIYISK